ncbi:MmgE/PrpD family protein [Chelativorans xinjiangense]|uniref:MmgE/PrpD family protein n=1 Tax=Chelativorans xinjiangense TaxID=2681485 RepID=UPI001359C4AC|nr:MmgE/PrpD family protein [Chelativorans xinjiangense]
MLNTFDEGNDSATPIRKLARWTLSDDPLWSDPLVARQARLLIADSIACAVAALDVSTPGHVAAMLEEMGGTPQCTLIGRARRSSILSAVLLNGALVRSLDYNDVQFFLKEGELSVAGHCSDNIPVALAAAERFGATGADMIASLAMGYELFRRLRQLMPFRSAWDGTSVSGLVAAAVYGRLAGLDPARQANALALGAARCATPSVVRWGKLSGMKNLANSMIAQSGVQGALLAERGVTGPLEVLDHRGGLHQVFEPSLGLERLWGPIEQPPFIMTSNIKPYACIGTAQTVIKAALDLHPRVSSRIDAISRIEVIMADLPMIRKQQGEIERRFPKTREAADHSFTFLPAVAMVEGAMTDRQFRDRRWEAPDMRRLIDLTELRVEPGLAERAPGSMPSRVRVTFEDGSTELQECLYDPGHSFPERGLNEAVVVEKFMAIAIRRMPEERARSFVESILCLETGPVEAIMAPLREMEVANGDKPR